MGRQTGGGIGASKGEECRGESPCSEEYSPAPRVPVPAWAESHLWPGWERDAFLEWCAKLGYAETAEPWRLFATWWQSFVTVTKELARQETGQRHERSPNPRRYRQGPRSYRR